MARPQLLALIRHAGTDGGESDAALLGRFVAGRDEAAFAELVRRYARLIWGQCRNLLSNEADADDAFQATFLALAKSARTVRDTDRLGPWLHAVAHRVCLNARRAATRRAKRERASAVREGTRPVADSAWDAAAAAVHEEVNRLPETLRVAFVLCHLEGKAPTDAAKQLGVPWGTFSARLCRARQRLLERLAARGITAAVALAAVATPSASAAAIERAITLGFVGATAPASIHSLLTGVTPMGILRAKVAVLVAMLAGAFVLLPGGGSGVPMASAQPPKPMAEVKPAKLDNHGDPLPEKAVLRLGTVRYRVPGLAGIGFKKTGELVALTQRLELFTFPADGGHKAAVSKIIDTNGAGYWRVAISADARFAAAHLDKGQLVVWDISGEKPVELLKKPMQDAYALAFSPDGKWLAVKDSDRQNVCPHMLCEVAKNEWKELFIPRSAGSVEQFNFTADGKWLAVATDLYSIVVETATATVHGQVNTPKERLTGAAVTPDGKTMAVLPTTWIFGKDPLVRFVQTANGGDAEGLTGPTVIANWVGFSPDGKTLRLSGLGFVREWDPVAGKWLREVAVPTDHRKSPIWSPDGKRFATANEQTVALVDATTWKPLHPDPLAAGPTEAVHGITVSPDGKVIATEGNRIHLWDAATGKLLGAVPSQWGHGPTLAFSPDSKSFIAVAERNIPVLYDARTGKELRRFKLPEDLLKKVSVRDLRLTEDGKELHAAAESASSQWKSYRMRWDVATGAVSGQIMDKNLRDFPFSPLESPDGKWQAGRNVVGPTPGNAGEPLTVLPAEESSFYGGAWSPDSTHVALPRATGTVAEKQKTGTLVVFDVAKKQKVTELNTGAVHRTAFSPDNRLVATVSRSEVVVWSVKTGEAVFRAAADAGNTIYARGLAFTPDGKRLITAHGTTALVWDIAGTAGK